MISVSSRPAWSTEQIPRIGYKATRNLVLKNKTKHKMLVEGENWVGSVTLAGLELLLLQSRIQNTQHSGG